MTGFTETFVMASVFLFVSLLASLLVPRRSRPVAGVGEPSPARACRRGLGSRRERRHRGGGRIDGARRAMRQRVTVITLGVRDLARARRFYEALGWRSGAAPDDDVVFFQAGEMVLALWDRERLAEDSCVADGGGWGGVTLALNVSGPEEVDEVTEQARSAGATIGREPAETFWGGYSSRLHRPGRTPLGGRPQPPLDARPPRVACACPERP